MDFTHDTTVTLATAAALANSGPAPRRDETIGDVEALNAFLAQWGWSHRARNLSDIPAVHALRATLRAAWDLDLPEFAAVVNDLLAENHAMPRLVEHGPEYGWHVHATPEGADIGATMAVEIGMALVDLVRSDGIGRLRRCAGSDCDDVLVDLSRNQSRKFCDGTCGTRANVAAYRARQAASD